MTGCKRLLLGTDQQKGRDRPRKSSFLVLGEEGFQAWKVLPCPLAEGSPE